MESGFLTVKEFCRRAGIGRTLFYSLVRAEKIQVRKLGQPTQRWPLGKMTRVPASELALFL